MKTVFLIALFALVQNTFAQLSGTKAIPGDYATIQAAIADLNTQGVGSGGVTFNVAAGYTENTTADLTITATGTAGNAIVFQKSGVGANPLVTRTDVGILTTSSIGADGDAVFRMNGTDYITFDGIDVAASDQGIEYGYYTFKPSGTDGCQFVTITNCVITMTKGTSAYVTGINISNGPTSVSSATGVVVSNASGRNTNVTITGNTVQNVHAGIYVRGATAMHDSIVVVGQSGAGNLVQNYGGGAVSTSYGTYFIYVDDPSVAYNTYNNAGGGGTAHGSTLYTVFFSSGVGGDLVCSNNDMTVTNAAASSSTYFIYSTNSLNSETVENNTFASTGTLPSGSLYFIYLSNSTPDKIINNNSTVGTFDKAGGGTYCYYNFGSPTSGTEAITNNTFSNINVASGSSTFYGIYSNTAVGQNRIMVGNTMSNVNSSSTGTHYAIYGTAAGYNQVSNNTVSNFTGGGSVYGIYVGGATAMASNNTVAGLTSTTTGTSAAYGAYSTTGTDVTWYNNYFSDINAPAGTSTTASAYGMYLTSGTNVNAYYNTVYLKYTATASANQSAALYLSSTPTSIDLRNNIFVNDVDVTAGTRAMAIRRSSTTATNLAATTNNNLYYAGTPSATNVIFFDGTNTDQTLSEYQLRFAPLESASVTSMPPFVNSTVTPYDLHMSTTTPTQTESGGTPVAGITTDFDGDTRNATTPDIGADEFDGIGADLTPPLISYDPLPNDAYTSTSVSLTATITDASGVATGTNAPRFYLKKINDVSYVFDNNPSIVGDDYTFTIAYSAIGGVSIGDTIVYYVAAQDVPGNAATNPSGGSGSNPPGTTPPPVPNGYIITDLPLSGTYTVGLTEFINKTGRQVYFETRTRTVTRKNVYADPYALNEEQAETKTEELNPQTPQQYVTVTETYKELMENGKPFDTNFFMTSTDAVYPTLTAAVNDLNLRGVSGAVTFLLVDATYPNETYPIVFEDITGASSINTITVKPSSGISAEIPGDIAQTQPTIYLWNTDWLTIDGSNSGGTTKDLKIVGLANITVASAIYIEQDADNNMFKNLILESQETSTGFGTFVFGPGPLDNNTIQNCTVKNIDTITFKPSVGVYTYSSNTGTGNQIIDCSVYDFYSYGIRLQGAPSTNTLVSGCDVYQTSAGSTSPYGIYISRVDGLIVEKCKIRELLGTSTIKGIYVPGSSSSGDFIFRNNFISLSGSTNLTVGSFYGLDYWGYAANSLEAYHNSIYIGGTGVTATSTTYALAKRDAGSHNTIMQYIMLVLAQVLTTLFM